MFVKFFIFMTFFTLMSCGRSPLFNRAPLTSTAQSENYSTSFKTLENYRVSLTWPTPLTSTVEAKAIVTFTVQNQLTDINADTEFSPFIFMASMGHGSSPIVVEHLSKGVYLLSEIYFTMAGDWQLHLTLKHGANKSSELIYDYQIDY